jgi:membrane protease YdiL (CAAX protease family)
LAEVFTTVINPLIGLGLYTALFIIMIVDAAVLNRHVQGNLVLSLTLVPLIRIISLSLPLTQIPRIWWYPVIYAPLLIGAIIVAVVEGYRPEDIGVALKAWPAQILIGVLGLGLGYLEYKILLPQPLVSALTWRTALLPGTLVFFSTGFVEEFIFRGVMQKSATDHFGIWGIIYVTLIFTLLHLGWVVGSQISPLTRWDIPFVFAVGLFFGLMVRKTGSLLGVVLCHGAINVMLFFVAAYIF